MAMTVRNIKSEGLMCIISCVVWEAFGSKSFVDKHLLILYNHSIGSSRSDETFVCFVGTFVGVDYTVLKTI